MITKKQAAILWAYDYKLLEKQTNSIYSIDCIVDRGIFISSNEDEDFIHLNSNKIGVDFFILCFNIEKFVMFDAIKDNLNDIEIEAISFKKYADITENINYKAIHEMHKENINVIFDEKTVIYK